MLARLANVTGAPRVASHRLHIAAAQTLDPVPLSGRRLLHRSDTLRDVQVASKAVEFQLGHHRFNVVALEGPLSNVCTSLWRRDLNESTLATWWQP